MQKVIKTPKHQTISSFYFLALGFMVLVWVNWRDEMGVLSDRIFFISAPDNVAMHPLCLGGFNCAIQEAVTIAEEADKIMQKMAEALHCYSEDDEGASPALDALLKYHKWKETAK